MQMVWKKPKPTATKQSKILPQGQRKLIASHLACQRVCWYVWCFHFPSEGNCREHLISLMPFRNVVGFDRLEQTVSWHSLLSVLQGLQNRGKPNSRAKVPELDQRQHLGNISLGPRRTCSTWEMGYISFARWELPLLLSWDNPVSSGVCGYYLSAQASKNVEILSLIVNKWNRHLEHNRARK